MTDARRRTLSTTLAFCAAGVLLAAASASADWLVTKDGARVETRGAWKIDGARVIFTLPNGTLSMLRLSDVDLDKSAVATAAAKNPAAATATPAPPKPKPILVLTEKDIPPVGEEGAEGEEKKPDTQKADDSSGLEVVSWEKTENPSKDGVEIYGSIKNNGKNVITAPSLMVILYGPDGGLMATNDASINAGAITPGATANFRVEFPGVGDFGSVKFDVRGRGFKTNAEGAGEEGEASPVDTGAEPEEEAAPPEEGGTPPPAL